MFALLAMAGDLGGALGPGIVGNIAQRAGDNMKTGMLAGSIFPFILTVAILLLKITRHKKYEENS